MLEDARQRLATKILSWAHLEYFKAELVEEPCIESCFHSSALLILLIHSSMFYSLSCSCLLFILYDLVQTAFSFGWPGGLGGVALFYSIHLEIPFYWLLEDRVSYLLFTVQVEFRSGFCVSFAFLLYGTVYLSLPT